ncbi:MAG: hypothetical protein HRU41_20100 [Saprospiraceae bacterium]|nr:hypothetical protein [Saprospiraceae bacterium]
MGALRILLSLLALAIVPYTFYTIAQEGFTLFSVFFGDLQSLTWAGQFNLDFLTYLILSSLWVAWRHSFSGQGLVLALCASVLGMCFLAPYLLISSFQVKGSITHLLLGSERADLLISPN